MKYILAILIFFATIVNAQSLNQTNYPASVASDSSGNIYIADTAYHRILRIDSRTNLTTVFAGTGKMGISGDGNLATLATFAFPAGVATDSIGNVYVADTGNGRIRIIDIRSGIINTIAGNGQVAFAGDGGPALNASFYYPSAVTVTPYGDVIVTDTYNLRVRKISGGIITTIAGNGTSLYRPTGDDYRQAPFTRLVNLSTRGNVQTDDNVMIAGFVLDGPGKETVLLRGRGPSLARYGISNPLTNPTLQVVTFSATPTVIAENDDWGTSTNANNIVQTGLAPEHPQESALLLSLDPGAYTVILRGANSGTGIGIVEVFVQ